MVSVPVTRYYRYNKNQRLLQEKLTFTNVKTRKNGQIHAEVPAELK